MASSAAALVLSGVGIYLNLQNQFSITPFTLLLHFIWAITISAWILNLRINFAPEKKSLLAIGIVVAIGSAWSSLQQWLAYTQTGLGNDLTVVVGAMILDIIGGTTTYTLYHLNRKNDTSQ